MDDKAPLGTGHYEFLAALQGEDAPFGETTPVDDLLPDCHALFDEEIDVLVEQHSRHEPDRFAYYEELARSEKERRKQERLKRLRETPPPSGDRLTLDEALFHLEGVTRSGGDRWRARCPIHGSQGGTLLISEDEGRPGEPRIHCFAGCSFTSIVRYLKACR